MRSKLVLLALALVAAAPPAVEWAVPPAPTHSPQTPEQEEESRQVGRELPPPEVLQPTLDPELPAYVPTKRKLSGEFRGAASDVMVGLANRWFEAFEKYYPDVHFSVSPPYAGSLGAKELVAGDLDFVFVSRELKPDDLTDFEAKYGYAPLSVPVSGGSYRHFGALDAVAFVVHKDNPIDGLTFDQLDALYSKTHHRGGAAIRTWGDLGLGGEWADKPVNLYGIQPWNGFEEFVRQRVLSTPGHRGEWRDDLHYERVVFPIAGDVAADRYGLGYTGVAYVDAPVKVITVRDSEEGSFQPATYDSVARATYPLSRVMYFNTNKAPGEPLPPAVEEFLKFVLSREGQQVVRDQATFLPLRGFQAEESRVLIRE